MAMIGVAFLLPAAGWTHPGQHVGLKIEINDEEVVVNILMSNDFARYLIPGQGEPPRFSERDNEFHFQDPELGKRVRAEYDKFFSDANAVRIDGILIKPILRRLQYVPAANPWGQSGFGLQPPDVELEIAYSGKGRPKRVSIVWELYPTDPALAAAGRDMSTALLAELDAYAERQIVMFSPEEPEVVWHAPAKPVAQRVQPVMAEVEPEKIAIPLVSVSVVVFWAVVLLGLRLWHVSRAVWRPALCLSVIPIAAAWFCHDVAVAKVLAPWGEKVKLPTAPEATEIFAALHRNIYRAFDYKTESDIYDVLAQSVAGDQLEQVYNEVYQGLIMRDQGGAVARVYSVDVEDTEMLSTGRLPDSDTVAFRMRCLWQVYGVVSHWGHFHSRTNEYQAIYTVAQLGKNWKITGAEVLQQRRLDSDDDESDEEESEP